jgi:hypothetical protein
MLGFFSPQRACIRLYPDRQDQKRSNGIFAAGACLALRRVLYGDERLVSKPIWTCRRISGRQSFVHVQSCWKLDWRIYRSTPLKNIEKSRGDYASLGQALPKDGGTACHFKYIDQIVGGTQ